MLYIYDKKNKKPLPAEETDFRSHEIMERKDIEKWVIDSPEILGEELFIITTEYDKFDKTKERLDVLAVDKNGKLVIIELKREESGKSAELQAIKYAAYCSTLTLEDVISLRKDFLAKNGKEKEEENIKKELLDFIKNPDFEGFDDKPRIILVAKEFRPEVTSTVLWLRKFGVDISCVKLTPYKIDNEKVGIAVSTIIPLPEAKDYIIKSEIKESAKKPLTRRQEEYLKFFSELREEIKKVIPNLPDLPEARPQSWYFIPTNIKNVHFEWLFHGRPRSLGVELHFEKNERKVNLKLLKEIKNLKNKIEKATGEKVLIERDWSGTGARLYIQKHIEKGEEWMSEELKKWAIEKMKIFYELIKPKLDELAKEIQ